MTREIRKSLPVLRQAIQLFTTSKSSITLDCHGEDDLSCSCAIASRTVVFFLRRLGIFAKVAYGTFDEFGQFRNQKPDPVENTNHSWTEFGDYIIDLTASQFNVKDKKFPDIIVTNVNDPRYIKLGSVNHKSIKPFYDWPAGQLPRKKYVNSILKNFDDLSGS